MDQNQISKCISDELQVPQILLWCDEIGVRSCSCWFPWGAASSSPNSGCWNRPANSQWAASGRFQGLDSDHTSGCIYPQSQIHPFLPVFPSGMRFELKKLRVNKPTGFGWFVCFFVCFTNFFPCEKNMSHCNHTLQKKRILEYFRCRHRRTTVYAEERENEARI